MASASARVPEAPGTVRESRAVEPVIFYLRWCKRCGICSAFCPRGCIGTGEDKQPYLAFPEKCNACGLCAVWCPDFAITVPSRHQRKPD